MNCVPIPVLRSCWIGIALAAPSTALAQCQTWSSEFATAAPNSSVLALASFEVGGAQQLFAGGNFLRPDNQLADFLFRWNGIQWTSMGGGAPWDTIHALHVFRNGSGVPTCLYGGGDLGNQLSGIGTCFNSMAGGGLWEGSNEYPIVYALGSYDDGSGSGPALYVGGDFFYAGGQPANNIARLDASGWSPVGNGPMGADSWVRSFATYDDGQGGGLQLYAGGHFNNISGVPAQGIARWNGTSWEAVGTGIGACYAMCVHDDGTGGGPALYAASSAVMKWDGFAWSSIGACSGGVAFALASLDDGTGSGPALFAGGDFLTVAGVSARRVAKWNGTSWSPLESGGNSEVRALAVHDDGMDGIPDLFAGGAFTTMNGKGSMFVGEWRACGPEGVGYCFGDGIDPLVTTPCPCGNVGNELHGCANSTFTSGARMTRSGTTSPNTILFTCTNVPNNTLCTFFQTSTNVSNGFAFGDGVRCVNTPLIRFGQQNSGQLGNPQFTASAAPVTAPFGFTRYYQCQYRNPSPTFCPPGTFNISNGAFVAW